MLAPHSEGWPGEERLLQIGLESLRLWHTGFLDGLRRGSRALQAAMDVGPFQELVLGDHAVELVAGDKSIVAAVDLAGPRIAGGGRHAEEQVRQQFTDPADHRGLADGRGADQYDQSAPRAVGAACSAQELNLSSRALR